MPPDAAATRCHITCGIQPLQGWEEVKTEQGELAPAEAGDAPTGWAVLAKNDSVVDILDTLLDMLPHREFNKSELADHADVSRKSVHNHIDLLTHLDVVTEVEATVPTRYRFAPESDVAQALMKLDSAVNAAGPHATD